MSDSTNSVSPSSDYASISSGDQSLQRSRRSGDGNRAIVRESRHWHDVFWSAIFMIHIVCLGFVLAVLGLNRFRTSDRLNIDRYTQGFLENHKGLTEDYWPLYGVAGGIGVFISWMWSLLLGSYANEMMKVSVHILTTYLAVVSVLCFWCRQFFWGGAFAIGALLQFLYVLSVIDRLPFTMLVLRKALKLVWGLPKVIMVAHAFTVVMLLWMSLWSFGAAGVVASSMGDDEGRWWLLVVLSVSLFWTGAVLCNTVHVIVSGMVFHVLFQCGQQETSSLPPSTLIGSLRYAVTTSFGSICYGSLFTAAIRTLRWEIRGFRSKICGNECLLCCVDFFFHLVETLVRFFNKYAYVQIAVYGKGFNRSARDAWELFQSTGVEALVAYDCSGAVLLMGTIFGGLITGSCIGIWAWIKYSDRVIMVASTSMLMGMVLVGLGMVVVESAVTSIYICFAEDPLLIQRWDADFYNEMSEMLHRRLQHRSARAREVLTTA
uniref:Choline transporter-like protein n=1 Tax=Noccaea caerulescens TaxID=107243 RepID=A0A1J3IDE8_NOCCA